MIKLIRLIIFLTHWVQERLQDLQRST